MENRITIEGKRPADATAEKAIALRAAGWSLEKIGKEWSVSRQRVAQIIKAYKKKQK